ncbi:MAG TPA: hypothetical protein VM577_20360, partial [Anaerovoracaceae bacterium]|nr:hypothetical protein [Anaerovoracaceae bacterium]
MEHFGYGNMGAMNGSGYSGYSGYSLNSFLIGFLVLLIKLLMVILVIAVIVGIVMWVKNNFFNNHDSQILATIKHDPIIKSVVVITLAVLGIILIICLLSNFTNQDLVSGAYGGQMGGYLSTFSIYGMLSLLIKVLSFVLVISLICALIAYV